MADLSRKSETQLYERVVAILEDSRTRIRRTVNSALLHAYWFIGREIFEVEQQGKGRAGYGDQLVARLAPRLTRKFGRGFTAANLWRMRQFCLAYPAGSTLPTIAGAPESAAIPTGSTDPEILATLGREFSAAWTPLFPASLGWSHYRCWCG